MIAWRKFFQDKHGKIVFWQRPNVPLIVWAGARLLQWPLKGTPEHIAMWIGTAAIIIWAMLGVVAGASYFRRTLGLLLLIMSVYSLVR